MTEVRNYDALTLDELPSYIASRPALREMIDANNVVKTEEIGDGNLNFVFRATDAAGNSVILKQALPYVRMSGEGWPMTPERARIEASSLRIHGQLVSDLVVKVLDEDMSRYIFCMEDLADYEVWRGVLNKGLSHEGVAAEIGRYVAAVSIGTSAIGLSRLELAENQRAFVNPELCTITDDLVFIEPVHDIGRNSTLEANAQDAKDFAADPNVVKMNALAKWKFATLGEALIHGDLHTGSVMVGNSQSDDGMVSVKIFDSEFAFYGPVGYDLGAIIANYVIAAARATAFGEDDRAAWIMGLPDQTLEAFAAEIRLRSAGLLTDPLWKEDFLEDRITQWSEEAWMFAACKMSRRVVGAAKTKDLTSLIPALREGADRGVLRCARLIAGWIVEGQMPLNMRSKLILGTLRSV